MSQPPSGVDLSKIPFLPPPVGQTSNFVDPPSLAAVGEGIGGSLIAIETILLVLRTCSNIKTFGKLRFEDYWIFFAATLTYGYFALIMLFRPIARHEWDIPLSSATESMYKSIFALEMMLGSILFFSKTCLLLLFHRIFSPDRVFRYKLYGAFAFIAITNLPSIPMYLAVCLPSSNGSWAEGQTKCGKTSVYSYVQGPAAVIFDLFAIYLPASVIVHLQMPLRRKIGVLAIFMTGLLAIVASIVGLVFRIKLVHDHNSTWASSIVRLCLLIESCVSIICSCMPAIPAILKLVTANSYFVTVRSRLSSRIFSSNKSKPSNVSSRRKNFPGSKDLIEFEPYVELIDSDMAHRRNQSATKTQIQHVKGSELPSNSGINLSVDMEVSSMRNTARE